MPCSKLCLTALSALVVTACSSAPAPASSGPATPTSASQPATAAPAPAPAVVSADQARRGENVFFSACTACHASNEFNDTAFQTRWRNRSAADLFDLMSATMPEEAPASLPATQYVDIVAYILTLNGFERAPSVGDWDVGTLGQVSLSGLGPR